MRFASVYRQFKDVTDFMKEVGKILKRELRKQGELERGVDSRDSS